MAALFNTASHYIFALWFLLLSSFFLFFPRLISVVVEWMSTILLHMLWPQCEFRMQVWNVLHAARWKCRTQKKIAKKSPSAHHHRNWSGYIFTTKASKARIDNRKKKIFKQQYLLQMSHNMVDFGLLAAEIDPVVWGTPANFNGFRVLAALLHGTLVVGVSQTLRHWTEDATYIRQGGHHIGHWPTF